MLAQRVITAVVLLCLLLVTLLLAPAPVTEAVICGVLLIGAWEWSALCGLHGVVARGAYVLVVAVLLVLAAVLVPRWLDPVPLLAASLLWWLVALVWILRYPVPIGAAAVAVCGVLTLLPAWIAFRLVLGFGERGPYFVLLVLAIVWAADIGAYFVGRRYGRLRLAPRVSPGKSWEGVMGGLVASAAVAAVGGTLLGLAPGLLAVAGAGIAGLSVVGDLSESLFKRHAGIKDSGQIFPGHGGAMDRLDSLTAALPAFALCLQWLARPVVS